MEQNRRQFYRIDKWVALEFQLIDSCYDDHESAQPGMFKVTPYFMLHAELEQLNGIIKSTFNSLTQQSDNTITLLELLNKKIDIIAQSLSDNEQHGFTFLNDKVSLSEGGISFSFGNSLDLGQLVIIRLIVPESQVGLRLIAEVKRCNNKDGQFDVGLEFQRMPEVCRTELARLIFRSQIEQHKAHKESLTDGEVS